jgi:ABC-type Mn2+/Zn2+ transport system ATPase subunit
MPSADGAGGPDGVSALACRRGPLKAVRVALDEVGMGECCPPPDRASCSGASCQRVFLARRLAPGSRAVVDGRTP